MTAAQRENSKRRVLEVLSEDCGTALDGMSEQERDELAAALVRAALGQPDGRKQR